MRPGKIVESDLTRVDSQHLQTASVPPYKPRFKSNAKSGHTPSIMEPTRKTSVNGTIQIKKPSQQTTAPILLEPKTPRNRFPETASEKPFTSGPASLSTCSSSVDCCSWKPLRQPNTSCAKLDSACANPKKQMLCSVFSNAKKERRKNQCGEWMQMQIMFQCVQDAVKVLPGPFRKTGGGAVKSHCLDQTAMDMDPQCFFLLWFPSPFRKPTR